MCYLTQSPDEALVNACRFAFGKDGSRSSGSGGNSSSSTGSSSSSSEGGFWVELVDIYATFGENEELIMVCLLLLMNGWHYWWVNLYRVQFWIPRSRL